MTTTPTPPEPQITPPAESITAADPVEAGVEARNPVEEGNSPEFESPTEEAATLRVRLREVQAEIADLETTETAKLTSSRRAYVEQRLGVTEIPAGINEMLTLHDFGDMWGVLGATPDQFYDDAGAFLPDALSAFIDDVAAGERAYLLKSIKRPVIPPVNTTATALAGMAPRSRGPVVSGSPNPWHDALSGARR